MIMAEYAHTNRANVQYRPTYIIAKG